MLGRTPASPACALQAAGPGASTVASHTPVPAGSQGFGWGLEVTLPALLVHPQALGVD